MTLHEYLRHGRISYRDFGRRIERDGAEVWRWAHGHRTPALDVAVKIEEVTGGSVSVRELLLSLAPEPNRAPATPSEDRQ